MVIIKSQKNTLIPVMKPKLPTYNKIKKYLKVIDKNRIYSNQGPLVKELAVRYGNLFKVDSECIVAVNNGTQALIAGALNLKFNRIRIPIFTFPAGASFKILTKYKIEYSDIDIKTWTLETIKSKNFLNLYVTPFGSSINDKSILSKNNYIIDAAASVLNLNFDKISLNENTIIMVSLHATKILGMGEGALLICGTPDLAKKIRRFINFGFDSERAINAIGTNLKMSEYSAAVGHSALDGISSSKNLWFDLNKIRNEVNNELKLNPTFVNPNDITPYWIVQLNSKKERDKLIFSLKKEKIESRIWWGQGLHKEPFFKNEKDKIYPNADLIAQSYLGLPFFIDISDAEINRIVKVLSSFRG